MKIITTYISIPLLLTTLVLSNNVSAEAKPYAGLSFGQSKVNDFCDEFTGVSCDDSDTALKVFGGAKLNKNFALEASYIDLGEAIVTDDIDTFTAEVTGLNLSAVGIIPASDSVDIFGKVGLLLWDLKLALSGTFNDSISEDGTDISFGFGANFNVNETFAIRAEFEKFNSIGKESTTGESSVTLLSLGAVFKF